MNRPLLSQLRYFTSVMLILVCGALSMVPAQSSRVRTLTVQPAPVNLDFEGGEAGKVPDGWLSTTTDIGYVAETTEENPKQGKRAAVLRRAQDAAAAGGQAFGILMQAIDATPFRGRRVRLRAAVRVEAAQPMARAQLWMRVDRPQGQMGFFDNMDDRPITSREWQYYEIIGDVDEDAAVLNLGLLLPGAGRAVLDDVTLEDMGKLVVLAEPARALTARGLENLTALARLLGYVRHFHPSDEAAAADWTALAVGGMRSVEEAQDAAELAERLETLFRPLAPTLRVFRTGKQPADTASHLLPPQNATALKIVSYKHNGFGQKGGPYAAYRTERVSVEAPGGKATAGSPDPLKPFAEELGGGVSCLLPLALYADAQGTLPRAAPAGTKAGPLLKYSGNDRATRLADVMLAWNVFQHFYPYFDVVKTDWPRVLRETLAAAATDADERAFLKTLRRMVVALQDGHGNVHHPSEGINAAAPVIFGWVENRLVILEAAPERAGGLKAGDVVLKVDGRPAAEALAEHEALISGATPQWRRYVALFRMRLGAKDSELRLEVQSGTSQPRAVNVKRDAESFALAEKRPAPISELRPGIFYLDLERIEDKDFTALLPKLEQATGIIFDLRGYPKVSPVVISHLIDKPVESARWLVPIVTMPDRPGTQEYDERGRWNLQPLAPRLKAKIAFLTDGRAISYAESYMGIIEAYNLASIVGETTAGTNGNINPFTLAGGYSVVWTGMRVLKHDRSQHHGIGIRPTVPVSRTLQGVAAGRDEQLERAIAIVSGAEQKAVSAR